MDTDKRLKRKGLILLGLLFLIVIETIGSFLLSIYTEATVLFALLFVAGMIAGIVLVLNASLLYTQSKLRSSARKASPKE